MAGQLTDACPGPIAAQRFERCGDLAVGVGLAGAAQLGVQGVLDEGVHEAVVARRVGQLAHQRRPGGGVEDAQHVVVGQPAGGGEQVEVEVAADHRGQRQHPFGFPAQPSDPSADHGVHARRQRHLIERHRGDPAALAVACEGAGVGEVAQHLTDEERVAAGLAVHLGGEHHRGARRARGRRRPR